MPFQKATIRGIRIMLLQRSGFKLKHIYFIFQNFKRGSTSNFIMSSSNHLGPLMEIKIWLATDDDEYHETGGPQDGGRYKKQRASHCTSAGLSSSGHKIGDEEVDTSFHNAAGIVDGALNKGSCCAQLGFDGAFDRSSCSADKMFHGALNSSFSSAHKVLQGASDRSPYGLRVMYDGALDRSSCSADKMFNGALDRSSGSAHKMFDCALERSSCSAHKMFDGALERSSCSAYGMSDGALNRSPCNVHLMFNRPLERDGYSEHDTYDRVSDQSVSREHGTPVGAPNKDNHKVHSIFVDTANKNIRKDNEDSGDTQRKDGHRKHVGPSDTYCGDVYRTHLMPSDTPYRHFNKTRGQQLGESDMGNCSVYEAPKYTSDYCCLNEDGLSGGKYARDSSRHHDMSHGTSRSPSYRGNTAASDPYPTQYEVNQASLMHDDEVDKDSVQARCCCCCWNNNNNTREPPHWKLGHVIIMDLTTGDR